MARLLGFFFPFCILPNLWISLPVNKTHYTLSITCWFLVLCVFTSIVIYLLSTDLATSEVLSQKSVRSGMHTCLRAKSLQSCPTLCDPLDYTVVHGILQAKILEWVVIPSSRGSFEPVDETQVSSIAGGFFTSLATREAHFKHVQFIVCQLYLIELLQNNGREINPSNGFTCSSPKNLQPNCPGHYSVVGGNK